MSNIKDSSILVTGANGFLGGVIVDYLKRIGARVIGTTRQFQTASSDDFIIVDLEDPSSINQIEKKGPFDAVIHLAAVLPGKMDATNVMLNNQKMTINILDWTVKMDVKKFLFTSSCNVYGYKSKPCTESTLPDPPNFYAVSKLACEYITNIYSLKHQFNNCVLRISAPYGPHLKRQTVINRFIELAAKKQTITIYGSGNRQQDFIYEDDVARAVESVLINNVIGTYNISGNRSISMYELACMILNQFDLSPDSAIRFSGDDPQESYRGRFLTQLAANEFGYSPKVNLEEGIKLTIQSRI